MTQKSFVAGTVANLPPSGIRKFFDIASEMDDVISMSVGEPDFQTPWGIREEAIYRLERGSTAYTSNSGLIELRREIASYMGKFGLSYDPKTQILVSVGASEDIDVAFRAILEPGDEVLIAEPCFVAYKSLVVLAGGVPVVIETKAENDFRLLPEEITAKLTSKTKALIMGYPTNPTGGVMRQADLEKIAEVLRGADILVISDEIYAELTYGGEHASIAAAPGMFDKTLVINGFSKAFSMTGWRIGFACGPAEIIAAMTKIHQYTLMCAPTTSQYAALEGLRNGWDSVAAMRKEYDARRRIVVKGFRDMGMDCFEPMGAFYAFPSIKSSGFTSDEFCTRLLTEEKVAVVPGNAFGDSGEGFVRCSYAQSIDNLREALARIRKFLVKHGAL